MIEFYLIKRIFIFYNKFFLESIPSTLEKKIHYLNSMINDVMKMITKLKLGIWCNFIISHDWIIILSGKNSFLSNSNLKTIDMLKKYYTENDTVSVIYTIFYTVVYTLV